MLDTQAPLLLSINPEEDLVSQLKAYEQASQSCLATDFKNNRSVRDLVLRRSRHIDRLLTSIWHHLEISKACCLIAVGGYGRGELHPYSDIDLLILSQSELSPLDSQKISQFVTLLWDIGLIVGQATRTVKQCTQLAKQDLTVVTNIMESRCLAGNIEFFIQMKEKTTPQKMWSARAFFDAKTQERKERYLKFDGSSYDLEPNVKSSPGGLRDIQLVAWVAQRSYFPKSLFQLIEQSVITKKEYYTLVRCQLFIWKVRFALHLISGKAEDRLLFDYQKDAADLMGFKDSENLMAVEKMMKRYYRSVLIVRNITDILLQSLDSELPGKPPAKISQTIDQHFQIINDRIDAIDVDIFEKKPCHLLKIFHLVAEYPEIKGITAATLRAIRASRFRINQKYTNQKINQTLFLQFWKIKHRNSRAVFLMKRSGVLSDYLPAFQQINGQMQYDMFHSYTVDEHTLFLLKNITDFFDPASEDKFPLCYQIMKTCEKPELIYLAGLFHDIGKGRGGDHSEIGAMEADKFCQQHHLPKQDSETISWLVANHLLMSLTAQKRDTSDPNVIKNFAQLVGSTERLELLYVLTVADIRATNRTLWNSWKASLLRELAKSTLAHLNNEKSKMLEPWQDTKQAALQILTKQGWSVAQIENYWQHLSPAYFSKNPAKTISWHSEIILKHETTSKSSSDTEVALRKRLDGGGIEIFIYSRDVDDLFATITATLDQQHLNVQGATIHTASNGYCYDSFYTLNETGKARISDSQQKKLRKAIKKNIRALKSSKIAIQKRMPRQIKHFNVNTEIVFSKDEFSQYTRLELVARDRPGLLAFVAKAFKLCEVRLHDARITTLGEKVEDTFIISHMDNSSIEQRADRIRIEKAIKQQLATSP
ncbi:MAG: [protein-PII] uridylyltransferase [Enterobacterales bacterium]|nr:[protein-PII] uridylyltransferase [Enterobacterales bacterium]